ncbi:MAG: hypothetical protein KKC99_06490 [Proteobacteria bacterium]|nr:hypothetical protein [Pseudomonadota bacterium]
MKKTVVYVAVIMISSMVLALGWVDLSLGSKRVEMGPLGVPVQYSCPERVASSRGVALENMEAVKSAILAVKKHVQSVEISVDENADHTARYVISVRMNSGSRVESRSSGTAWEHLESNLARTIDRCVAEFMSYNSKHANGLKKVTLTI